MKKNKLFLVLMLILLVLTACQSAQTPDVTEQEGETSGGEITVFYLEDPPFWKEQAARFTEETGIVVNWVGVPFGDLHNKLLTAFAGGDQTYDVIHVRDDYVAEFGSRGFLLPLESRISEEFKGTMPSGAWENLSWEGHNYGVPRYFWMWQFYYNASLLEEAGLKNPPKTWDELATMAETLTKDTDGDGNNDQWGYCEAWGENLAFHPFQLHLLAEGGSIFDEDGNLTINSDAGKRALQTMVDMAETDNYCPSAFELMHSGTLAETFAQGNIGMIVNSTQTYRMVNDPDISRIVGEVNAALVPGAVEPSSTFSETGGLAIPVTSKNPDLAWEYIKFVTSYEEQKMMALELSSIPTNSDALNDPDVQEKYPNFEFVPEQMEHPFGMIKHPNAAEIDRTVAIHVIAALHGKETVEEALDYAQQEVMSIIE